VRRLGIGFCSLLAAVLLLACGEWPIGFRSVSFDEAHHLLGDPEISVVDAHASERRAGEPLPGALRWRLGKDDTVPASLPEGGVLIVASTTSVGHRSAAALARAGHSPVLLFVPENEEERSTLYTVALQSGGGELESGS